MSSQLGGMWGQDLSTSGCMLELHVRRGGGHIMLQTCAAAAGRLQTGHDTALLTDALPSGLHRTLS